MADPVVVQSHIEVANLGLIKLGINPLADFDDTSNVKASTIARNTYDNILKLTMEQIPWDFCTVFKKLNAITLPDDIYDYASAFNIPGGVLRPYAVQGQRSSPGGEWIRRGNLILSNLSEEDGSINTQLIMYEANVGIYSPTFIEAVASRCAAEWAPQLLRVTTESDRLMQASKDTMRDAASSDGGVGSVRRAEVFASCVTTRGHGSHHDHLI